MNLQVLISTLNRDPKKLIKKMHLDSDAIIINQCDENSTKNYKYKNYTIKNINTTSRGIGISRQLALKNSTADIILFADDDEILTKNYKNEVIKAFSEQPKADFIIFNIDDSDSDRQHGSKNQKIQRIHFWNCFKYGTARFAIRRNSIIQNNISFDERFGAALYGHGEDSVFIRDCLREGLRIITHPYTIAKLTDQRRSLWFNGYDKKYYEDTGAIFARSFGFNALFLILPYLLRNRSSHFFQKLKSILDGFFSFVLQKSRQNCTIKHRLLEIAIVFCSIFSFKIYGWLTSAMLVAIGLLIYFLFNKKYRFIIISLLKRRYINLVFIILAILVAWSLFVILINNSGDFSYIKLLTHLTFNLALTLAVFAFFKKYNRTNQIVNTIILTFLFQIFCEWAFVMSPSFSDIFDFTRTSTMIDKSEHYHNFRGIAISTFGFFSLSIAHCVVNLLYWTKYNTLYKSPIIKTIVFAFLLSGAFFAGRTVLISLLFIPFIVWQKSKPGSKQKTRILREIVTLAICVTITFIIALSIPRMQSALNFITEPFRNITSSHKIQTTSTNSLIKMYQTVFEKADQYNYAIGDGKYLIDANGDTKYYGGVDIGFIRKIYFFGIIGFILSVILQIAIFGKTMRSKTSIVIFIMLCLLELKGEVLGASVIVNTIIFLYALAASETPAKIYGKPLVSVIIPTYGRSSKIISALKSIKAQTYTNLEVIVVDDNANDKETREATKAAVSKFSNVKFIENAKNLGGGGSRNHGFVESSGEYIAFLDDDDEYEPTKIEKQLALMQEKEKEGNHIGLIYCWRSSISVDKKHKKNIKHSWEGIPLCEHICFMIAPTSCWLCSKEAINAIGGFDDVPSQQDAIFILKLLSNNYSIFCVQEALVKYFEHSDADGITKRSSKDYFNRVIAYQKLCRSHFNRLTKAEKAKAEFYFQSRKLNLYLDQNNKKEAKKLLVSMYKKRPFSVQNLKNLIKVIIK